MPRKQLCQAINDICYNFYMKEGKAFDLELFFAALADRTRLRLLNLMRGGEVCVCFFADTLDTNNPKISRHLAYLKRAGLVAARREGKWMHYKITEPQNSQAAEVFSATMKMIEDDPQMQSDNLTLMQVCCSPRVQIGR